jgi:hypothetical protein
VLVVAGGGGGSEEVAGGGGGAGGVIYNSSYAITPGQAYTVTVGAGGATTSNGQSSNFANIVAVGGGAGGNYGNPTGTVGRSGGSGGGLVQASGYLYCLYAFPLVGWYQYEAWVRDATGREDAATRGFEVIDEVY